jgi:hypothetical protein
MNPAIRTGCLVVLTVAALLFLKHLDRATQQLASDTGRDFQGMSDSLVKATSNLNHVLEQERQAQTRQTVETNKILAHASDFFAHTDVNLNGKRGLIPSVASVVQGLDQHVNQELLPHADQTVQAMTTAVANVGTMAKSGNDTFAAATSSFQALTAQFSNPTWGLLLGNVNTTALHLSTTTERMDHVASFYEDKLTTPKGFVKTLGAGLFSLIVPGADVYTAYRTGTAALGTTVIAAKKASRAKGTPRLRPKSSAKPN